MLPETSVTCDFCRYLPVDDLHVDCRTDYLLCLARIAGTELRQVIKADNKDSHKVSQCASLANYNPADD